MENKKLLISSIITNFLIFILVIIGTIFMFTTKSGALFVKGMANYKFFTVESNTLMGLIALIVGIYQILILKGIRPELPFFLDVLYLISVVSVALTFITVMVFLGPVYGYGVMFRNANLFFHLIIPVISIASFLVFGNTKEMKLIHIVWAILPPFLYGCGYMANIVINNGYGNFDIDFYGFGKNGPWFGLLSFAIALIGTFLITFGLYSLNKLIHKRA